MRILVLLPSLLHQLGGIQTYSQAVVWSLNALANREGAPHPASITAVTVLALHDHEDEQFSATTGLGRVKHFGFASSKMRFSLASLQGARKADVIIMAHVHFAPLLHLIRWVAPQASVCIAAHGIEVWKRLTPLTISALRHADQVWPVSNYTRQRMLAENPGLDSRPRYAILPNTLGPNYPPTAQMRCREALSLPPGKILLCVSRMSTLEPYKNVEMIIRAMPEVLRAQPETTLVMVGPGDDRPRLETIVAELELRDHVTFAGRVSDEMLQSYFSACDLFVLPSTGEGFGIVYLEAMYHGKACIGADAGGVPEVIENGVTGALIDPAVPAQLPAAIIRLLQNDATRTAMGHAGNKRQEEKFSLGSFRSRLGELLRGLA